MRNSFAFKQLIKQMQCLIPIDKSVRKFKPVVCLDTLSFEFKCVKHIVQKIAGVIGTLPVIALVYIKMSVNSDSVC